MAFQTGATITGFKDVALPQMRRLNSTVSEALNGDKVKISDTHFLFALAKRDQDHARNLDLMRTRAWFDFPLLLKDNRVAKLVFQKSAEGETMLDKAFGRQDEAPEPVAPTDKSKSVPLEVIGGTYLVPVTINGQITLKFVIDSGASDVSVPADVALTLVRTGTITKSEFIGKENYQLADGSTVPSQRFVIRSLKVGDLTLENVTGGIAPVEGQLLLGQSFLSRFKSWSIDNQRQVLILGSPQAFDVTAPAATPSYIPLDPRHGAPGMPVSMAPALDAWLTQSYYNCWTPPPTRPEGEVYVAKIKVTLGRDGSLSAAPVLLNPPTDPAWRAHAQSAMLAVKKCDPLRVPTQYLPYFEEWKVETIHFDPRETQN